MLTVTAPAKEFLRTIDIPDGRALRLETMEGSQLGFVAGQPRPDGQVVEESGQELLRIEGVVGQQLDGHRLNRVDTAEGPRLTIEAPEQPGAARARGLIPSPRT